MRRVTFEGMNLLRFESLAGQAGLVHSVTTGPHNLAPHRGADRERAMENRRRLCAALGLEFDRLTAATQIHGAEVLPVTEGDAGRGRDGRHSAIPFVDGLITDRPGVGLLSMSADCPTLLIYDPVRRAVGVAHASWRGTLGGIAANLVAQMRRCFGCRPTDLMVGIGPSAGPCCYEVRDDVRRVAATRLEDVDRLIPSRGGRFFLDLWATLESQLLHAGVSHAHIEQARLCTMCDPRFYSHRRDGAGTGRFGVLCALKPVE
jgi:YfiH family protein